MYTVIPDWLYQESFFIHSDSGFERTGMTLLATKIITLQLTDKTIFLIKLLLKMALGVCIGIK